MSRSATTPGRPKRPRTQLDRLVEYLERAGSRGLTQSELDRPPDGLPIRRVASRVHELREQRGYVIDSRQRRDSQTVYVLVRKPQLASRSSARTAPALDSSLFERSVGSGRNAILGPAE